MALTKQIPPSGIDLAAFAGEHLLYEAQMLVWARDTQPRTTMGTFDWNAVIEVYVLHFRNLVEFFYPRDRPHASDVIAAYYAPSWTGTVPKIMLDARNQADKQLAHLSSDRMEKRGWDLGKLSCLLRMVIKSFFDLKPSMIPEETAAALRNI